jgi:ribosomal protein RSM22 (predicted rRNA methylase)
MNIDQIHALLEKQGIRFDSTKNIAESILQLSDFYIQNPNGATPWQDKWAQTAYLSYYLPLNFLRAEAVIAEAKRFDFFKQFEHIIDFGSGLGSGSLGLTEFNFKSFTFVETSEVAHTLHKKIFPQNLFGLAKWKKSVNESDIQPKTLGVFSFSLTELEKLPAWTQKLQGMMIIEPSTQDDGRKLLDVRQKLIATGFSVWAPCVHQKKCPLYIHSKTDWCHHRVHWSRPEWFKKIENYLPIRNDTLTLSYLLMSRALAPDLIGKARITGDLLKEKGKARQLVCRGEEREFFAWMARDGEAQEIPRGALIEIPTEMEAKSNELRLKKEIVVV